MVNWHVCVSCLLVTFENGQIVGQMYNATIAKNAFE